MIFTGLKGVERDTGVIVSGGGVVGRGDCNGVFGRWKKKNKLSFTIDNKEFVLNMK